MPYTVARISPVTKIPTEIINRHFKTPSVSLWQHKLFKII